MTADWSSPDHAAVTAATEEIRADLVRADTKASALLALSGAAVAIVAASPLLTADNGPGFLTRYGLVLLIGALAMLLLAVRPRLAGAPWRRVLTPGWDPEAPEERLEALAHIAEIVYLRIRRAVDLALIAIVAVGVGIIWEAVL